MRPGVRRSISVLSLVIGLAASNPSSGDETATSTTRPTYRSAFAVATLGTSTRLLVTDTTAGVVVCLDTARPARPLPGHGEGWGGADAKAHARQRIPSGPEESGPW